ncbi:MAG: serine hydrolase [Actinobacteria bacterium]|nr:serine hydrolase [Actinomycetota bacterium]
MSDALMQGFPVPADSRVTIANWQDPPFNRWGFSHVRELIPTQRIAAATHAPSAPRRDCVADIDPIRVPRHRGGTSTFRDFLLDSNVDAAVIMHDGNIVFERYFNGVAADTPHLLMSVSKSLVGCVAGILSSRGELDVAAPIERYVPESADSGYSGATVRDLLDMRTGVAFNEDYTDPDADVRVVEEHIGWRPSSHGEPRGLYEFLRSLSSGGSHGGPFTYRSADTDMLGWVCERAAGVRMADLISDFLWRPMGAEFDAMITCDALGSAIHDGGVCACARDLARFGQLLLDGGAAAGRAVIPEPWLADALGAPPEVRAAFAASPASALLPGGWYRNQFWFLPQPQNQPVQLCRGIYGQFVMVDRATRTVGVLFSTWPDAEDSARTIDTVNAFHAVGQHLAGVAPTRFL